VGAAAGAGAGVGVFAAPHPERSKANVNNAAPEPANVSSIAEKLSKLFIPTARLPNWDQTTFLSI